MRIAIFGAGALGSLVGGLLSSQNQVTLICRERHAAAINRSGLEVSGLINKVFHPAACIDAERVGEQDVVFITVKAYDTQDALNGIKPMVGQGTTVVSMQNGLNNADLLVKEYGDRAVVALTSLGSTYLGSGRIRFAGRGETIIGSRSGERSEQIKALLEEAGILCKVTDDLEAELWMKAIVNACINPITALTRERNGCIASSPPLKELAMELCQEAVEAATANGISLPVLDPFGKVIEVVALTAENKSSMLQDVEAGKRTEIDEITGEIVRRGEKRGLKMTRNRTIWALVYHLPCSCS